MQKPSDLREYFEALLIAALFLGFTNTFVIKTFFIPSGSMEDTLLIGDHLFVNRYLYGPAPTRLEALLIAALFLGFTNTFVIKTFFIPSGSMEDTLLIGDHLFVNRYLYGPVPTWLEGTLLPAREIRRGDVVIFRSPEEPANDLVKRCIGVGGDEIRMVDKVLYINGQKVEDESFAARRDNRVFPNRRYLSRQARLRDNFGPLHVPEGEYFFLGDNRDYSFDSRFWGTVPRHFIKGRAFIVYWSYGGETPDGVWRGWGDKIVQIGKTIAGFVTRTRWQRTLHLVR